MDIVSLFLSILDRGRAEANRVSDRRAEVARLNAEVKGEAGRALDMLNAGRARLVTRCSVLFPDNPEVAQECDKAFAAHTEPIIQILAMTGEVSEKIASSGWGVNWDLVLQKIYEWRATASRFGPFIQGVIDLMEDTIDRMEAGLDGNATAGLEVPPEGGLMGDEGGRSRPR